MHPRVRSVATAISSPRFALLLAIVLQSGVFFALQGDAPDDDALAYAENAHAIATDPAAFFHDPSNHPFVMRVGLTIPLAAIYRVLGVSTWTTNLPSLIGAIVILLVVYAAAPTARATWVGLGFALSSMLVVGQLTELNVDMPCGAATAVSILVLSRRDRAGSAWRIAGAVGVWFFAFLIKENAIWFAPAWLYAVAVDLRAIGWRQTVRRYAPAVGIGLVLALAYLGVCATVWGDPMARTAGINRLADLHPWAPHGRSSGWWLRRLTLEPPRTFLAVFGAPLVIAVVGARRITGPNRIWIVATAGCLLMLWFGSASSAHYVPLPLDQSRMLIVALPPLLVVAALAAGALRWRWPWLCLCIPILVVTTVRPPVRHVAHRWRPPRLETALYRTLGDEVAGTDRSVVVCGNIRCQQAVRFYFGFEPPSNLRAVSIFDFAASAPPTGERVYIVVEPYRERVNDTAGVSINESIDGLGLRPVYDHRRIRLYDAGDGGPLHAMLRSRLPP